MESLSERKVCLEVNSLPPPQQQQQQQLHTHKIVIFNVIVYCCYSRYYCYDDDHHHHHNYCCFYYHCYYYHHHHYHHLHYYYYCYCYQQNRLYTEYIFHRRFKNCWNLGQSSLLPVISSFYVLLPTADTSSLVASRLFSARMMSVCAPFHLAQAGPLSTKPNGCTRCSCLLNALVSVLALLYENVLKDTCKGASCPACARIPAQHTLNLGYPRRWNVTTSMVGWKKRSYSQKSHPKWQTPEI